MSNGDSNPFEGANAFMKMWSDFAASMTQAGMTFSSETLPPDAARQIRNQMLSSWSDYCERFMRSDEFREMMGQSLASAIQARRHLNDFLGQVQHELQGASRQDIDQLMLSLRHIERRVVDGMERLSERLDHLDARLSRLESAAARSRSKKSDREKKKGDTSAK